MNKKEMERIKRLSREYDSELETIKRLRVHHDRLKEMVEIYGKDAVIAATGYSESTLNLHLSVVNPIRNFSGQRVEKAEWVFSRI